ncbi:YggS family pyridoxal phosphate-dependent enzyme [Dendrosporobacter sp. 1207_IL3150]|uniref:YggS family pyridoxal phosphate-dependent enzyme n=1 Tax=Dendrosporobacter sp. 1207_IL3150 TaxID=3084054 RepID=UPI002FD9FFFB
MSIAQNLTQILSDINLAIERVKVPRIGDEVKLVAVTKNHDVHAMREAIDNGVYAIGENRVQEVLEKCVILDRKVEWHLIGHLQTNKVKQIVPTADLIQSVDSERIALEINRIAEKLGKRQDVLIQVNVSGEESKFGINPKFVIDFAKQVSNLNNIRLCGLMTIAPNHEDIELTRPVFRELYSLFTELRSVNINNTNIEWLSMGMTNDFTIAIEEGSNLVRVGTGIFGARQY